MIAHLPLGGQAQRFFIGQVQPNHFLLGLLLPLLIDKLIGVAGLHPGVVGLAHLLLIGLHR